MGYSAVSLNLSGVGSAFVQEREVLLVLYGDRKLVWAVLQAQRGSDMLLMIHAIERCHESEAVHLEPFAP